MKNQFKNELTASMKDFHLPRYSELSDVGLYLEQTTTYINQLLAPLGCVEITSSMIRNYVKKGLAPNPVKKQYFREHIAHLICITILKHTLSLEHIYELFRQQKQAFTNENAYNYFCMELENILFFQFGLKDSVEDIGKSYSVEREMLRSAIIAVSHIIYLDFCFKILADIDTKSITQDKQ